MFGSCSRETVPLLVRLGMFPLPGMQIAVERSGPKLLRLDINHEAAESRRAGRILAKHFTLALTVELKNRTSTAKRPKPICAADQAENFSVFHGNDTDALPIFHLPGVDLVISSGGKSDRSSTLALSGKEGFAAFQIGRNGLPSRNCKATRGFVTTHGEDPR